MKKSTPFAALRSRWSALADREKKSVILASVLIALALLWWVGISPALQVLQQADTRQRLLGSQLQNMQTMAQEVRDLQGRPVIRYDDAVRALSASVRGDLGANAQITFAGDRATVSLKGVPAAPLARWLSQARLNARALPVEARLVRGAGNAALWDGTVVLTMPPK